MKTIPVEKETIDLMKKFVKKYFNEPVQFNRDELIIKIDKILLNIGKIPNLDNRHHKGNTEDD